MRSITRRTVYTSRSDVFRLVIISDWHLGNIHANEKKARQIVQSIADDPMAYWIGLGDYCEFINLHDPRFDPSELASWMMESDQLKDIGRAEAKRFLEYTQPIRGKCIALCAENHEEMILKHSETDVYANIVEGLADGYNDHRLDHRGFVNWQFTRMGSNTWTCKIHATHGSGGNKSGGAAGSRLQAIASQMDGIDLLLMGHLHTPEHKAIAKLRAGQKSSYYTVVHCVSRPSLCSDMKYIDNKDLWPSVTGYVEILIKPDKRTIQVSTLIS